MSGKNKNNNETNEVITDEETETQKIIKTVIDDIDKKNKSKKDYHNIISGINKLDQQLLGFTDGDLNIIASRPGIGKTTLALAMFTNIIEQNINALFISFEKKEEELMKCIFTIKTKINYNNIDSGFLSNTDYKKLIEKIEPIFNNNCLNFKSFNNTDLIKLKKYIKEKIEKDKIKIVFIDYLHLIIPAPTYTNRWEQVCEISRSLKSMAMEFNIPFIVLSPLHRNIEKETPELDDLSESGSIEYEADKIIILYRKKNDRKMIEWEGHNPDKKIISIYIAKNRRGRTTKLDLLFNYKEKSIGDVENIDNK
jgi:replicative DNA helicase